MAQLIECIPNFSEARRPEVIDKIAAAVTSVDGARLLDRSSDLDHNRTVLTFVGPTEAVEEAAFRAIKAASELIDLNHHTGQHPRIGATDVVPFVPLSGVTMQECVMIARRLAGRVGSELQIPVYLYEYAASRPERTNLEDLRKGQFEGLKTEIETNPDRKPDYGPARLGPAGATIIGARNPLIAFNVYLTTSEVEVAKKIARSIRQSTGGMRFVKALGLSVEGRAQVSINFTNFHESPIGRVLETIRREALRFGVGIHHSELVGLIPEEALMDAAVWYTQLDQFSPDQILETRLHQLGVARVPDPSMPRGSDSFLDEVAAATAAPGGGSAAAYAAALGAALSEMVAGLTVGKKKYGDVEAEMQAVRLQAAKFRNQLYRAVEDDAAAFEAVLGALKLPKDNGDQDRARNAAIQVATLNAAHIPLRTAADSLKVMELARLCARHGNLNAISDAMSAALLAHAALSAAGYNVRINVHSLADQSMGEKMLAELSALEDTADKTMAAMRQDVDSRAGLA